MRILYIEDDMEDTAIFHDAVKVVCPAAEFEAVANCQDALYKLKTGKRPDLIFFDLVMQFQSGKECLKVIIGYPLLKAVPLIMYSASTDPRDKTECLDAGAAHYLVKPGAFQTLCTMLKPLLAPETDR